MVSDSSELPFFPKYETQLLFEDRLRVTWFESNFSQSHYNVHNSTKGSNACTLIAILTAAKCDFYDILVSSSLLLVYTFSICTYYYYFT